MLNDDWQFCKNHGVPVSSLKDYFPGFKGCQQTTWFPGVSDVTTFTTTMADFGYNNNNDKLSLVEQQEHVALITWYTNIRSCF